MDTIRRTQRAPGNGSVDTCISRTWKERNCWKMPGIDYHVCLVALFHEFEGLPARHIENRRAEDCSGKRMRIRTWDLSIMGLPFTVSLLYTRSMEHAPSNGSF
eukprot:261613-Amorphochlora_amoeboformis.AAC.1